MKKLWIVEKIMTMGSKFDVYDNDGYHKYYVQGEKRSLGDSLTIYSSNRKEKLMVIRKDKKQREYNYKLFDKNDILVCDIRKIPNDSEYEIKGSVGEYKVSPVNRVQRCYDICKGNESIGSICKQFSLSEDGYNLEFKDTENEMVLLSLVIVIDMVRFHIES